MEMPVARPKFAAGAYAKRWAAAKTAFKSVTGKKKPAPSKKDQTAWVQLQTLDGRQATDMGALITHTETALAAYFNGFNTYQNAEDAYKAFSVKIKAYIQFLDTADSKLPLSDQKIWDEAVSKLKIESQHIQTELKGWLVRAQQYQTQVAKSDAEKREDLQQRLHAARTLITDTELWLGSSRARQMELAAFKAETKSQASAIQKLLVKLHRLPVERDEPHLSVRPPQELLVALDVFAAGKHKVTSENERQEAIKNFAAVLDKLINFLQKG